MVVNPIIARRSTEARHLLRELYRHASCSFDDHAREFLRKRIRDRFRECRTVLTPYRQSQLLKNGRKVASTLQRANAGDPERIFVVMRHAYGRVGKRWHELMKPYLDGIEKSEELVPGDPRTATPNISPPLRVLLLQHMESKKLKPAIPETNIWDKPFPVRRKVNTTWKHFTKIIAKVTPPLSEDEMLRLERLALGQEEPIPPKRKMVVQCRDNVETKENRNITRRFQKRMYAKVLQTCPRLVWSEQYRKWWLTLSDVTKKRWPVGDDPDDFAGLDPDGSLPGSTIRRPQKRKQKLEKRIKNGVPSNRASMNEESKEEELEEDDSKEEEPSNESDQDGEKADAGVARHTNARRGLGRSLTVPQKRPRF